MEGERKAGEKTFVAAHVAAKELVGSWPVKTKLRPASSNMHKDVLLEVLVIRVLLIRFLEVFGQDGRLLLPPFFFCVTSSGSFFSERARGEGSAKEKLVFQTGRRRRSLQLERGRLARPIP